MFEQWEAAGLAKSSSGTSPAASAVPLTPPVHIPSHKDSSMLTWALLIAATLPSQQPPLTPDTQLLVTGSFEPKRLVEGGVRKEFTMGIAIERVDAESLTAVWIVDELGAGTWSWVDHFGKVRVAANGKWEGTLPTLHYEREDGGHEIPLPLPFARFDEPFQVGYQWSEGRNQHEVQAEEPVDGVPAWLVTVRSPIGVRRQYAVAKGTPLVLRLEDNVFVGQGEEHRLRYKMVRAQAKSSQEQNAIIGGITRLEQLREQLKIEPRRFPREWNDEQLAALRGSLDQFAAYREVLFLAKLVANLDKDAKQQKDRASAVTALRDRVLGNAAPAFKLTSSDGEEFASANLAGQVVVLHFWEYRDNPLQEPYGQSAYLDFLARNFREGKLKVLGVAVDPRLGDADSRGKALQSVKKFKSFMNISYPVLLDDGELIRRYGDPRTTGTRLPLFVVLDGNGKVVHYHVGNYEVIPNRGLEELEKVVRAAGKSGP